MGAVGSGPGPVAVATRDEPWGVEDPLTWYGRRVRKQSMMAMFSIALLVLFYGGGMYGIFTLAVYESDQEFGGAILLVIAIAFILSFVVGGLIVRLARTAGRYAKLPGSPTGTLTGRILLWFAALLWFLLIIGFIASATITTEPDDNSSDEPFPIGIFTAFPVYLGLCVALFTTGAAMLAWSDNNRVETMMLIGLGWAAFGVFLILPITISNIGSGDFNWESLVFWARYGMLFPAILPWLIVLGINYIHGRSIGLLMASRDVFGSHHTAPEGQGSGVCSLCGGSISVYPQTQEVFCTACGDGLGTTHEIIVDDQPAYEFVEQVAPSPAPAPAPTHVAAPTHAHPPPGPAPAPMSLPARPGICTQCGGFLSVHPRTGEVFCPACGAGLSPEQ